MCMTKTRNWTRVFPVFILSVAFIGTVEPSLAQSKSSHKSQSTSNRRLAQAKVDLATAAKAYKDSIQALLTFEQDDVKLATAQLEKRKALLGQNIISSKEVEESERGLDSAKARVKDTIKQLAEAELFFKTAASESNDYSRTKAPYQRDVLLRVLRLNALPVREIEEAVETRGVGFQLTPEDEAEFSSLGATREFLRIIVSNYRNK